MKMGSNNRKVSLELLRSTVLWVLDSVNRKVYVKLPRSSSFVWLKKYLGPNLENWGRFQNYKKISTKLKKMFFGKKACHSVYSWYFFVLFLLQTMIFGSFTGFWYKKGGHRQSWGYFFRVPPSKGGFEGDSLNWRKKKLLNNNIEKVMNFENMYFMQNLAK